jgi:hypothetical protein
VGIVLLVLSPKYFKLVTHGITGFSCLVCLYLRCTGRTVHNPRQVCCQTQLLDTGSYAHQASQPGAAILMFLSKTAKPARPIRVLHPMLILWRRSQRSPRRDRRGLERGGLSHYKVADYRACSPGLVSGAQAATLPARSAYGRHPNLFQRWLRPSRGYGYNRS